MSSGTGVWGILNKDYRLEMSIGAARRARGLRTDIINEPAGDGRCPARRRDAHRTPILVAGRAGWHLRTIIAVDERGVGCQGIVTGQRRVVCVREARRVAEEVVAESVSAWWD